MQTYHHLDQCSVPVLAALVERLFKVQATLLRTAASSLPNPNALVAMLTVKLS